MSKDTKIVILKGLKENDGKKHTYWLGLALYLGSRMKLISDAHRKKLANIFFQGIAKTGDGVEK